MGEFNNHTAQVTLLFDNKTSWKLELPIDLVGSLFDQLYARQMFRSDGFYDEYKFPHYFIDSSKVIVAFVDYSDDMEVEFE